MKILTCASDPGGARNIGPVLLEAVKANIEIVVWSSKKTKNIFLDCGIKSSNIQQYNNKKIKEKLLKENPDVILCGATRFGYKLPELYIIDLAKINNIPCSVVLDEWFYYAKRFWNTKKELKHLPDIIFCQDRLAYIESQDEGIPEHLLKITGSPAYSDIFFNKKKLFLKKSNKSNKGTTNILFISEAHSETYGNALGENGPHGKFQGYTEIIVRNILGKVIRSIGKKVIINEKLHPNQKLKKIKPINLIAGCKWNICKSNSNLDRLLFESDIVIGMRSAVLMEAWLLGKIVISFQPNLLTENKCTISRRGFIKHIESEIDFYKELKKYIGKRHEVNKQQNIAPQFCNINASKNILKSLKEMTRN